MLYFILVLTLASGTTDATRRFDDVKVCRQWAGWLKGVHERQGLEPVVAFHCQGMIERCDATPDDAMRYEMCNEMVND